ncbi:hypothetical protein [Rubripirellula obstinata]|uniref:hypothetical protein n=1 Tax=Rubripirellula obstinata TaxID=406547 RepID=UPI00139025EE|nr:hypothetical protein [Rubripirellula obstinata]
MDQPTAMASPKQFLIIGHHNKRRTEFIPLHLQKWFTVKLNEFGSTAVPQEEQQAYKLESNTRNCPPQLSFQSMETIAL